LPTNILNTKNIVAKEKEKENIEIVYKIIASMEQKQKQKDINISKEPERSSLKINSNKEREVTDDDKESEKGPRNTISSPKKNNYIIENEKVESPVRTILKNEEKIMGKEHPMDSPKVNSNKKNYNNIIDKIEVVKLSLNNVIPFIEKDNKNDALISKENSNSRTQQNTISNIQIQKSDIIINKEKEREDSLLNTNSKAKNEENIINKEALKTPPQNIISNIEKVDIPIDKEKEKEKVSLNTISKPKNEEIILLLMKVRRIQRLLYQP